MVAYVVVMEVVAAAASVAVLVVVAVLAAVMVVPGAGAGSARPVGTAGAEPEAAAHCSELELLGGTPQP